MSSCAVRVDLFGEKKLLWNASLGGERRLAGYDVGGYLVGVVSRESEWWIDDLLFPLMTHDEAANPNNPSKQSSKQSSTSVVSCFLVCRRQSLKLLLLVILLLVWLAGWLSCCSLCHVFMLSHFAERSKPPMMSRSVAMPPSF